MGTVAAGVGDSKGTWTRISFFSTLTIGVHLPVCTCIHTDQFFFPLLTIGVHLPVCTYTQTHILVSIPKIKIKLVLWDMHVRVTHCESNPHTGNLGRSVGFCLFGKNVALLKYPSLRMLIIQSNPVFWWNNVALMYWNASSVPPGSLIYLIILPAML